MKLLRLYIQECGVFKQTLIDFTHHGETQDIICLSGVNGSGKTTILELIFCLVLLLDPNLSLSSIPYDRLRPNVLTRVKFAQLDVLLQGSILSLVIGKEDEIQHTGNSDIKQEFIIEPEIGQLVKTFEDSVVKPPEDAKEVDVSRMRKIRDLIDEDKFLSRRSIRDLSTFKSLVDQIQSSVDSSKNTGINLPFAYFFTSHDREILDLRYNSIPKDNAEYTLAHRYSPKADDLKKFLVYYEYAFTEKFEELKEWANKNVLSGKSIDGIDRPNFNVLVRANTGKQHGLELLSSGEESLLILAVQIYVKAHENCVVLIDEIDESLHPEFQEKIIRIIQSIQREKDCQIIVSSHSDIVWSAFENKGLIDLTQLVV